MVQTHAVSRRPIDTNTIPHNIYNCQKSKVVNRFQLAKRIVVLPAATTVNTMKVTTSSSYLHLLSIGSIVATVVVMMTYVITVEAFAVIPTSISNGISSSLASSASSSSSISLRMATGGVIPLNRMTGQSQLDPVVIQKYMDLPMPSETVLAEYVWVDAVGNTRSKTRTLPTHKVYHYLFCDHSLRMPFQCIMSHIYLFFVVITTYTPYSVYTNTDTNRHHRSKHYRNGTLMVVRLDRHRGMIQRLY
jgi:hypothetical protein